MHDPTLGMEVIHTSQQDLRKRLDERNRQPPALESSSVHLHRLPQRLVDQA